jgi:hypothetical protein
LTAPSLKLCSSTLLYDLFVASLTVHPSFRAAAAADLIAARSRDQACAGFTWRIASCRNHYLEFVNEAKNSKKKTRKSPPNSILNEYACLQP